MRGSDDILKVTNISKNFGGLQAINRLSFAIPKGQIFSIIGPNGAGKTTVINLVSGLYPAASGEIYFKGRKLNNIRPHRIAYMGITRTFQNIQVFHNMSVRENVMVGMHTRSTCGFFRCLVHTPLVSKEEKIIRKEADGVLEFLRLDSKADRPAAELPYGDQKRLEIARALIANPRLLLLDEPVAGLNLQETEDMSRIIRDINRKGVTIVLVEHDMKLVMGISDTITVLNYGEKIAEGTSEEIQNNSKVVEAYLGKDF
jgi:branched-chain amino acid transport system ATP-binding protein